MCRPGGIWIVAAALGLAAVAVTAAGPPMAGIASLERLQVHAKSTRDPPLLDDAADEATFRTMRNRASDCARRYGDTNEDGFIASDEIDSLKGKVLHFWERAAGWLISESTAEVIRRCDADGDGRISAADFEATRRTCLATPAAVAQFYTYFCARAADLHLPAFRSPRKIQPEAGEQ
jgi:hypothetical protein